MSSKADRMDEAKELFAAAANCFKLTKNGERSAEAYMRCIQCSGDDESDIAGYYLEAAHAIKGLSTNKFLEYAKLAIDKFCMVSRIS